MSLFFALFVSLLLLMVKGILMLVLVLWRGFYPMSILPIGLMMLLVLSPRIIVKIRQITGIVLILSFGVQTGMSRWGHLVILIMNVSVCTAVIRSTAIVMMFHKFFLMLMMTTSPPWILLSFPCPTALSLFMLIPSWVLLLSFPFLLLVLVHLSFLSNRVILFLLIKLLFS